jgi:hypothetical protein
MICFAISGTKIVASFSHLGLSSSDFAYSIGALGDVFYNYIVEV